MTITLTELSQASEAGLGEGVSSRGSGRICQSSLREVGTENLFVIFCRRIPYGVLDDDPGVPNLFVPLTTGQNRHITSCLIEPGGAERAVHPGVDDQDPRDLPLQEAIPIGVGTCTKTVTLLCDCCRSL